MVTYDSSCMKRKDAQSGQHARGTPVRDNMSRTNAHEAGVAMVSDEQVGQVYVLLLIGG